MEIVEALGKSRAAVRRNLCDTGVRLPELVVALWADDISCGSGAFLLAVWAYLTAALIWAWRA
jgi:hypothetical protein